MMAERTLCIYIIAVLILTLLTINVQGACGFYKSNEIDGLCYDHNFMSNREMFPSVSWSYAKGQCDQYVGKLATFKPASIEQMMKVFTALRIQGDYWMDAPVEVQDIGPQWMATHKKNYDYFGVYSLGCKISAYILCIEDETWFLKNSTLTTASYRTPAVQSNNKTLTTKKVTCLNGKSVSVDGQCYRVTTNSQPWIDANSSKSLCNGQNEVLATISSVEQGIKVLSAFISTEGLLDVWVNYQIKNDRDHFARLVDHNGCKSYSYGYYSRKELQIYSKVLCVELLDVKLVSEEQMTKLLKLQCDTLLKENYNKIRILLIFLFVIALLMQGLLSLVNTASLQRVSNIYAALWSAGVELNSTDLASCALNCLQNQNFCRSFSFNERTSQCTLGYCVKPSANSTLATVKLYQIEQQPCESTAGFNVYMAGNIKACLWISSTVRNFTNAAAHCAEMSSTLVTIKSEDKREIVQQCTNDTMFIGLDDMSTEGTFIWHDDHTVMTNDTISQLFIEGEPNNAYDEEDCIEITFSKGGLNDITCAVERDYICEKSCFMF